MDGGKLINTSTFNNDRALYNFGKLTNKGKLNNTGTLNNSGTFIGNADSEIKGTGSYIQDAGITMINGVFSQASMAINGGVLNGSGIINSDVTIDIFGSINPGNSPDTLTINGDFATIGLLGIEIGGLLIWAEYDVLDISGIANLGGTLNVNFFDLGFGFF